MPNIAETLVTVTLLLDAHPRHEQTQALAFLAARYGLPRPYVDATELAERRRQDRTRAAKYRESKESRDAEGKNHVTPEPAPAPVVKGLASKGLASSTAQELPGTTSLEAHDQEFLEACSEPFRMQWLNAEFWVSLQEGYPKVSLQLEANKYIAWWSSKPAGQKHKNVRMGFRRWVAKAASWAESREMSKAVRR